MDPKPIIARLLSAGIGLLAAKLAARTGVVIDDATQAAIVVAVYGALHSVSKQVFGKP